MVMRRWRKGRDETVLTRIWGDWGLSAEGRHAYHQESVVQRSSFEMKEDGYLVLRLGHYR
jgi:hypothetical protein